jgi:FtsH-binding integral membrane protein
MKKLIVICPKCKIRVIPKSDGTCPSCQRDISRVQPIEWNRQREDSVTTAEIALERPVHIPRKKVESEKTAWNETGVFERTLQRGQRKKLIESAQYNLIIGLVLFWGFGANWLLVRFISVESLLKVNLFWFLLGYFGSCFLGIRLFTKSTNPWVSFAGYNLVVIPFGLVLNIIVSRYDLSIVVDAMRITTFVTLIMMLLGTYFTDFFEKIELALFLSLLAVVIVEFVEIFIFRIHHDVIDWIVALIMCGYIGYDWGRANRIPRTWDNAVDSAAALYMDIVNLFVRTLKILGRGKK